MPDRNQWPLEFSRPGDDARARRVLDDAGFTDRSVAEALGLESVREAAAIPMPPLLRLTGRGRPLDTLIRLFLMGVEVPPDDASKAVAPMALEAWIDAGLLEADGNAVRGAVHLLPLKDLRLAFDLPRKIRQGRNANYVMGVGSSTLTLANATVRRHSRRTLDLGAGCGLLAFLAAPHSRHVVAVDRSRRAVNMAAFNARLNGLENVEVREGDLFEPVRGERFDLVVSNPPFVISPETHFIYRDSGMKGDEITGRIVRQVPDFLEEGGFCQVLCNWAHVAGQPWQQRLAAWFEGTGCDAWVMRSDTLDAPEYAAKWIRHTERDDDRQFDRRFDEWMAYYDRQQIEAVSGGLITLRRRSSGAAWFRADDGPPKMLGPAGEAIARAFGLRDFLASHGDDSLPAQRLQISPGPAGPTSETARRRLGRRALAPRDDARPGIHRRCRPLHSRTNRALRRQAAAGQSPLNCPSKQPWARESRSGSGTAAPRCGRTNRAGFFTAIGGREGRQDFLAHDPLHLLVHLRMTATAPRPAGAVELGSQKLARLQGGVDSGGQGVAEGTPR